MGVVRIVSSGPRREYYPSGPWIKGIRPDSPPGVALRESNSEKKLPNPDPQNYNIIKVLEKDGFILMELHYPDCTNYEGRKILLFKGVTLVDLINQKIIDPHFFQDEKIASPIARFIPDKTGWAMGEALINVLKPKTTRVKKV